MLNQLEHRLLLRQQQGHLRQLPNPSHLVDFASNDYLGLARCPDLKRCVLEEGERISSVMNGRTLS